MLMIPLLVELVVSMHDRMEFKPGPSIQWLLFYSYQQQYGHSEPLSARCHINQGHVPVCPPHISRTQASWWASLTESLTRLDREKTSKHTNIVFACCFFITWPPLIAWNRLCMFTRWPVPLRLNMYQCLTRTTMSKQWDSKLLLNLFHLIPNWFILLCICL